MLKEDDGIDDFYEIEDTKEPILEIIIQVNKKKYKKIKIKNL